MMNSTKSQLTSPSGRSAWGRAAGSLDAFFLRNFALIQHSQKCGDLILGRPRTWSDVLSRRGDLACPKRLCHRMRGSSGLRLMWWVGGISWASTGMAPTSTSPPSKAAGSAVAFGGDGSISNMAAMARFSGVSWRHDDGLGAGEAGSGGGAVWPVHM